MFNFLLDNQYQNNGWDNFQNARQNPNDSRLRDNGTYSNNQDNRYNFNIDRTTSGNNSGFDQQNQTQQFLTKYNDLSQDSKQNLNDYNSPQSQSGFDNFQIQDRYNFPSQRQNKNEFNSPTQQSDFDNSQRQDRYSSPPQRNDNYQRDQNGSNYDAQKRNNYQTRDNSVARSSNSNSNGYPSPNQLAGSFSNLNVQSQNENNETGSNDLGWGDAPDASGGW